jgi:hypothetical protein
LDRESRASTSNPIFPTSWEFFRLLVRRLEMLATFNRALVQLQLGGSGLATLYKEAKEFFKDTDIFGNSSIDGTGIDQNIYDQRIENIV